MHECLYCAKFFYRSDSLSANTSEYGSYSFCCKEHEDKFKEEHDAAVKAEADLKVCAAGQTQQQQQNISSVEIPTAEQILRNIAFSIKKGSN